jgi:hypothetical protein
MKVKLLKQIRKRYTITHYPDGVYWGDNWHQGPYTVLYDNNKNWRYFTSHEPKDIAFKKFKGIMMEWIESDYKTSRKRKYVKVEKLWYKNVKKENVFLTFLKKIKTYGR